jgi:hypothetical protein
MTHKLANVLRARATNADHERLTPVAPATKNPT